MPGSCAVGAAVASGSGAVVSGSGAVVSGSGAVASGSGVVRAAVPPRSDVGHAAAPPGWFRGAAAGRKG